MSLPSDHLASLKAPHGATRVRVAAIGLPRRLYDQINEALAGDIESISLNALKHRNGQVAYEVMVLGPDLERAAAEAVLGHLKHQAAQPRLVLLGEAARVAGIEQGSVHYCSDETPGVERLVEVIESAPTFEAEQEQTRRIETLRRIQTIIERVENQRLLTDVVELACIGLKELVGASAVHFTATDPLLREQLDSTEVNTLDPSAHGLSDYLASTGGVLCHASAVADPHFEALLDAHGASGREHLLAVSVSHPDGRCLGVFVALRDEHAPPFDQANAWAARQLTHYLAGPLGRWSLEARLEQQARDYSQSPEAETGIFRRQAVEHHAGAASEPGEALRLSPAWVRWCYPVLLIGLLAGLLYTLFAEVTQYASGPAVVQLQGVKELSAPVGGSVSAVMVSAGTAVERGQALVRFYRAGEQTELRRLQQAFELELVKRLRRPNDPATERSLTQLRARLNAARAALEERTVYAPTNGVVVDVRARPGQVYQPGEVLLSLRTGDGRPMVIALIPGSFRPQLEPGMPMRLELRGYQYAYQELTVDAIGKEVVGPDAARRYLGADIAGAVQLNEPVIPVRAKLEDGYFTVDGKRYRYYDGMLATAEVGVDSERLLFALIPGLKQFTGSSNGR